MYASLSCLFVIFITVQAATVITVNHDCEDSNSAVCEVKEVRVNPCGPAKNNQQRCKLKSGANATIEADFIPHFDAKRLETQAYANLFTDLPMPGMDTDGCKSAKCPVKSGTKDTYTNTLFIAEFIPGGNFNIKFRWWSDADSKKLCCVALKVSLL